MTVERVKEGSEGLVARGRGVFVHSQVRRIREEDLRICDGTGEGLSAWDRELKMALLHLGSTHSGVMLCSPLGNNVDPVRLKY